MLAPNPFADNPHVLIPIEDSEIGRWVQVSRPKEYHLAMRTAREWKRSGHEVMVSEKPDGYRVYIAQAAK